MLGQVLVITLLAALSASPVNASDTLEASPKKISYPDEGVDLGSGWDALEARKTSGSCIALAKSQRIPPQDSAAHIRRIVDRFTLDKALDVSVEMKMQGFLGFGGSAKARYSDNLALSSEKTSFLLSAWVANEAEYVEPRAGEAEIYLLPALVELKRTNPAGFRARCGDHFVTSLWTGAELFGFISFESKDEETRQNFSTELEASGFMVSGGASFSQVLAKYRSSSSWTMSYFQSGGSGEPLPTTETGFMAAANGLRDSARRAPKRMWIAIRPYSEIKGWPANDPIVGPSSDYQWLVVKLAEATKLYDDLETIIRNPRDYEIGYPLSMQNLRDLQDRAQTQVALSKQDLEACVRQRNRAKCGQAPTTAENTAVVVDVASVPVPKKSVQDHYISRTPACIPWDGRPCPPDPPPTLDTAYHPTAVANAIYQLKIEERSRGYCAFDRAHYFCMSNATKQGWREWIYRQLKLPKPGPLPITSAASDEIPHLQAMPPRWRAGRRNR